MELLVLLICPLPFYETFVYGRYTVKDTAKDHFIVPLFLSDYILAFMFLRLFFLTRCFFNYSSSTDAYFKKLCKTYGFNPGYRFTLKTHMTLYPERTIVTLFFFTVFCFAYVIRIFELTRFMQQDNDTAHWEPSSKQYFDAVYLVIVTLTTVGYGDFAPLTIPGKVLVMFISLWGAFMISLIVLTVSSVFSLKKNQLKAMRHIRLTKSSVKTIELAYRFYKAKKKYYETKVKLNPEIEHTSEFLLLSRKNYA